MSKATITLGGVDYEIDQLPIGTLRELDAEMADAPQTGVSGKERELFFFDQCLKIIEHALKDKNPEMTVEKLKAVRSTMTEFFRAREVVLRHAGLIVDKAKSVGESGAEAS